MRSTVFILANWREETLAGRKSERSNVMEYVSVLFNLIAAVVLLAVVALSFRNMWLWSPERRTIRINLTSPKPQRGVIHFPPDWYKDQRKRHRFYGYVAFCMIVGLLNLGWAIVQLMLIYK